MASLPAGKGRYFQRSAGSNYTKGNRQFDLDKALTTFTF